MAKFLPEISKQISSQDILEVLEKNFTTIAPTWISSQILWMNNLYRTFNDYEKFMIIMHLLMKTFDVYSKNFVKLNYEEYFDQTKVEIEKINLMEISKVLNIPKETTRRKINELEKLGTIKRINRKFIIDRNTWPRIKPEVTIERISRFLSTLSEIISNKGLISKQIKSENLMETSKEYFSFVWKLYYEMQMPMLLGFKKIFGDLETFHIHGICISNHALNSKRNDNSKISKELYLEKYFFGDKKDSSGVNAMSISDITGIPRATVLRKLNKLIKKQFLILDDKKHYYSSGVYRKEILDVQKNTFNNLSKFAACIYNLTLIK